LVFDQHKADPKGAVGYVGADYGGDLDRRRSLLAYIFTLCDANQAHKEMTKDDKVHKEKSSQSRDLTRGRIGQRPKHLKFFLLVFLMITNML